MFIENLSQISIKRPNSSKKKKVIWKNITGIFSWTSSCLILGLYISSVGNKDVRMSRAD